MECVKAIQYVLNMREKPAMRELQCPQCGNAFYRSVGLKQIQKFCSQDCAIEHRTFNPITREPRFKCAYCRNPFRRDRRNMRFCSAICYAKAKTKYRTPQEGERIRKSLDYQIEMVVRKINELILMLP